LVLEMTDHLQSEPELRAILNDIDATLRDAKACVRRIDLKMRLLTHEERALMIDQWGQRGRDVVTVLANLCRLTRLAKECQSLRPKHST